MVNRRARRRAFGRRIGLNTFLTSENVMDETPAQGWSASRDGKSPSTRRPSAEREPGVIQCHNRGYADFVRSSPLATGKSLAARAGRQAEGRANVDLVSKDADRAVGEQDLDAGRV